MIYEYRAYYVMPGRMPDLQRRFADITMKLFKKHGITVVGFWETVVGESNEMVYICSYDDLAHRERVWKTFMADPEWLAARKASEAISHLGVPELVALDGARHLGQRRIARVAPVARVEGAVEVHEEVEQGVVRPRLAGQVEGVVRVRHVLEREVRIEADGETVEHDRVLELLGEVLGLDQPRGGGRIERLGDVGARGHEAQERLVAGALALVAQHLEEQVAILGRQRVALVEALRGGGRAREARQGIARGVDAPPERPAVTG